MTTHRMTHTDTIDGVLVFTCPECGHRIFWTLGEKPLVDEEGDLSVMHTTLEIGDVGSTDSPVFRRFIETLPDVE